MSLPKQPLRSGKVWWPELPSQWELAKLGRSLQEMPCYGVLVPDHAPDGVQMLRIKDLTADTFSRDDVASISTELSDQYSRTLISEGDLVLTVVGTIGEAKEVPRDWEGMNLSRAIARLQISGDTNAGFLRWIFASTQFRHYTDLTCVGTAQRVLNMIDLWRFPIPRPPLPEQKAIAAFLDRETGKIDALVEEQRRLIALLKEKRQAVISHAVTKGLDPAAPMKPSGIDWLGDIPAHWEMGPLKRLAVKVQTGGTPASVALAEGNDDELPWFTPGDFTEQLAIATASKAIPKCSAEEGEARMFPAGSVLVVGIGATLGKTCIARVTCSANQQINAIIPATDVCAEWLGYALRAQTEQMRVSSNASTIGIMNQEKTKALLLARPPLMEQKKIVSMINALEERFDALTAEATRAIALLHERRAALISAAVTGKIDVRDTIDDSTEAA
ncbi:restriction endonuclease subunit S [Pseudooceanicola marinus]|uniref:restriction endonuclease subunit S n=1 Tax=Pseudooceanicola marinus TaxID=396013 RepID=UPI001CD7123F|nr:restriction endonuclease subunit S [Pseudooceanicola marinus]MCA1338290.1 restriction endonuclease subunit S [Pseudooceanicola marinus]